jgi:hypothetical protein
VAAGQSADLVAILSYTPQGSTPGFATFPVGVVQVPPSFHVKLGSAGTGKAQLDLGFGAIAQTSCTYTASPDGTSYVFSSCNNGAAAGDLTGADFVRLTILGGDPTAGNTKVRATLAINPAGDLAGPGIIPPMPTYWGDDAPTSDQIITAYFAAANAAPPTEESWVRAPIPEFARRSGDGSSHDNLTGPPPPNDPPFDQEGHMSAGNNPQWDAYWRLCGGTSWDVANNDATTNFNAELSAHAVLWGNDITVLAVRTEANTHAGAAHQTGFDSSSTQFSVRGTVLGSDLPSFDSFDDFMAQGGFDDSPIEIVVAEFPIWIFQIQAAVGPSVSLALDNTSSLTPTGFQFDNWRPAVSIDAHVFGGVNIGVASGGVDARIHLLQVSTPLSASAQWSNFNTDRSTCGATMTYALKADSEISTLGGRIDLVATLGVCPFCLHGDQPIFAWDGIDLGTRQMIAPISGTEVHGFPDVASACLCDTTAGNCGGGVCASSWEGSNCGSCGVVCGDGNACDNGSCVSQSSCPSPNHGQACGACGLGKYDCEGVCHDVVPSGYGGHCGTCGQIDCSGNCVDNPPPLYGTTCTIGISCSGTVDCGGQCSGGGADTQGCT